MIYIFLHIIKGGNRNGTGFQRNNNTLTFVATVLILIIVFAIQILGDFVVKRIDKR